MTTRVAIESPDDILQVAVAAVERRGNSWALARVTTEGWITLDIGLTYAEVTAALRETTSMMTILDLNLHRKRSPETTRPILPVSVRWEVLARDRFTCVYCGAKAPDVKLHVDHRLSVYDGGTDDLTNLVTACQDCNLGKGARSA